MLVAQTSLSKLHQVQIHCSIQTASWQVLLTMIHQVRHQVRDGLVTHSVKIGGNLQLAWFCRGQITRLRHSDATATAPPTTGVFLNATGIRAAVLKLIATRCHPCGEMRLPSFWQQVQGAQVTRQQDQQSLWQLYTSPP